uniref:Uncharacterized protein n=1 Tax=Angiostrongylus cantonensis TaxID=6313 RepID=A0A0K0CTQ4_ANGCA
MLIARIMSENKKFSKRVVKETCEKLQQKREPDQTLGKKRVAAELLEVDGSLLSQMTSSQLCEKGFVRQHFGPLDGFIRMNVQTIAMVQHFSGNCPIVFVKFLALYVKTLFAQGNTEDPTKFSLKLERIYLSKPIDFEVDGTPTPISNNVSFCSETALNFSRPTSTMWVSTSWLEVVDDSKGLRWGKVLWLSYPLLSRDSHNIVLRALGFVSDHDILEHII